MKINISNNIICMIFLLGATVFYNCKTEDKVPTLPEPITQENAVIKMSGVTVTDTSGPVSTKIPKPIPGTTPEEGVIDIGTGIKIVEDLKKSKYSDCNEIIIDYIDRIKQFENGNRKPLREFPEKDDPTINLCKNMDALFASKFDSLVAVANILVDNYLKSLN